MSSNGGSRQAMERDGAMVVVEEKEVLKLRARREQSTNCIPGSRETINGRTARGMLFFLGHSHASTICCKLAVDGVSVCPRATRT